jgi:hypothetical protein
MDRRKGLYFFGVGAIATALTVGSGSVGCQSDSTGTGGSSEGTTTSNPETTTTTTNSGSPTTSTTSTASLTTTTTTTTTTTSTSTSSSPTSSTGTASGTGGSAGCVSDQDAMISDVAKGANFGGLGAGIKVQVANAVVTSPKFLVSQSSTSGSCLWGIYLSAPGAAAEQFGGVLALSYGTPAMTHTTSDGGTSAPFCPTIPLDPAGDAFPDDLAPGDVVTVIGKTDIFPDMAPQQVQLSNVCSVTVVSRGGAVPTPATLSASDASLIAGGDAMTTAKWAGVRVEMDNPVSAGTQNCGCPPPSPNTCGMPSTVDGCGSLYLTAMNAQLQVTDKIYYQGLLKSLGKTCHEGPLYTDPTMGFTKVVGTIGLDYDTWAIYPNNKCTDLAPGDADCMAAGGCTDCGPGSGMGQCL